MEKDEGDLGIESTGHDPARLSGLGYPEHVYDRRVRGISARAMPSVYGRRGGTRVGGITEQPDYPAKRIEKATRPWQSKNAEPGQSVSVAHECEARVMRSLCLRSRTWVGN